MGDPLATTSKVLLEAAVQNTGAVTPAAAAATASAILITIESPDATAAGGARVHPIDFTGPTMPQLRIRARIQGLTEQEDAALPRQVRLTVRYVEGNRNDLTSLPLTPAGPWVNITGYEWQPDWSGIFCGGWLIAYCRTSVNGVQLTAQTPDGSHLIWGRNPDKALPRAFLGAVNYQVVGHRESRFTQFSDTTNVAQLSNYRPGPFPVPRSFDNGFGLGQLTAPAPSLTELWNWQANVAETARRLTAFRDRARAYQIQVRQGLNWNKSTGGQPPNQGIAFPDAPDFTEDQLDLEMWARYNGGFRYHNYDPTTRQWIRRLPPAQGANTSLPYAEALRAVRNQVAAGTLPAGWD